MSQPWGSSAGPPFNLPSPWHLGDYTSLQVQLFVILTISLTLSILFTSLRLWSRGIKCMRFQINDYLLLTACFCNVAFFVVHLLAMFLGTGRNFLDIQNPMASLVIDMKVHGAIGILWSAVNTLVKLSMADLYTRIFPHRLMRITAMTFSVVSVINFIFATAAAAVSCDPAASAAQRVITRNCYMALGIINLLLDIVIIVMPMPALSTLQLPIGKKISLIGIFALGFVITAISAVRVAAFSDGLRNIMGGKGYAYNSYAMSLWSYLETSLSVINACLPVIFPALLAITGRLESLRSRIKGSAGSLRKYGRHSPSNGSAGKSDPSFPPTTTIGESRRFGRFWRTPNLDKTLPARPTHCSSETCVSAGDGAGHSGHGVGGYSRDEEKATFYLEETRVGDEGSLSDSEKLPEERTLAERRGMEGGKITVVKGWVVGYESR